MRVVRCAYKRTPLPLPLLATGHRSRCLLAARWHGWVTGGVCAPKADPTWFFPPWQAGKAGVWGCGALYSVVFLGKKSIGFILLAPIDGC
jgi:hypothetical protein